MLICMLLPRKNNHKNNNFLWGTPQFSRYTADVEMTVAVDNSLPARGHVRDLVPHGKAKQMRTWHHG